MTFIKILIPLITLSFCELLYAQNNELKIPMTSDQWETEPDRVEFITPRGVQAARG